MDLREIKAAARAKLHGAMKVPALYIAPGGGVPVPCDVRVHTKNDALGKVKGTSLDFAERQELIPQLIFLRSQVPMPANNAVVSVAPGEAYRVSHSHPPDGLTITAEVAVLSAAQTVGLPVPEV